MPDAQRLAALRRDVDRKPHKLKNVLTDARIREEFFNGITNDAKKAVRAFVGQNKESALKTKPKGYENDHRDIDLLRLKNFTIGRRLADDEVVGPGALDRIAGLISTLVPFITYLNGVVMPDHADESDEDEGGSEPAASAADGDGDDDGDE